MKAVARGQSVGLSAKQGQYARYCLPVNNGRVHHSIRVELEPVAPMAPSLSLSDRALSHGLHVARNC